MNNLCLNRSGFEGLGGTSLPKFLLNAPPPPHGGSGTVFPKVFDCILHDLLLLILKSRHTYVDTSTLIHK